MKLLCVLVTAIALLVVPSLGVTNSSSDRTEENGATPQNITVSYALITVSSPDCDSRSLAPAANNDYPVKAQHRRVSIGNSGENSEHASSEWVYPDDSTSRPTVICEGQIGSISVNYSVRHYTLQFPASGDSGLNKSQLRFVQSDHRGGYCDCWAVTNLSIAAVPSTENSVPLNQRCNTSGNYFISVQHLLEKFINSSDINHCPEGLFSNSALGFCFGSASLPRGFVTVPIGNGGTLQCDSGNSAVVDSKFAGILLGDQCDNQPHINVKFNVTLGGPSNIPGSELNFFYEGLEFAFKGMNTAGKWIPLVFYTTNNNNKSGIYFGERSPSTNTVNIRGFNVSYILLENNARHSEQVKLCGKEVIGRNGRFRWLQTNDQYINDINRDRVLLDDIQINAQGHVLLADDFDNQTEINSSNWDQARYATIPMNCSDNCQLQFGATPPTFPPVPMTTRQNIIVSREISTVPLHSDFSSYPMQVHYTLITLDDAQDCVSSPHIMYPLPSSAYPGPVLQTRQADRWYTTQGNETEIIYNTTHNVNIVLGGENVRVSVQMTRIASTAVQYANELRLVQREHRGGFCDCWAVARLTTVNSPDLRKRQCNEKNESRHLFHSILEQLSYCADDLVAAFCFDSALVPREFLFAFDYAPAGISECGTPPAGAIPPPTNCGRYDSRVDVTFDLTIYPRDCDEIEGYREGIELSFRSLVGGEPGEWIPLMFYTRLPEQGPPFLNLMDESFTGTRGNITMRGYSVPYVNATDERYSVSVCGSDILEHPLQFRWLQNSFETPDNISEPKDVIMLDDVTVSVTNETHTCLLLADSFEDQSFTNSLSLNPALSYNVEIVHNTSNTSCRPTNGGALAFYVQSPAKFTGRVNDQYTLNSRQFVLNVPNISSNLTNSPPCTPIDIGNMVTTPSTDVSSNLNDSVDTTPAPTSLTTTASLENTVLRRIMANGRFSYVLQILGEDPYSALLRLNTLLNSRPVDFTAIAYLFSATVNRFGRETLRPATGRLVLTIASRLMEIARDNVEPQQDDLQFLEVIAGSTLLRVLDRYALNNHNTTTSSNQSISNNSDNDSIVFRIEDILVNMTTNIISPIKGRYAEIAIPLEEVLKGIQAGTEVRIASFLLRNMSGLLPRSFGGARDNSNLSISRLASPVITTTFQCDNCTTSNFSTPVRVTFRHQPYDECLLRRRNSSVRCVFWQFDEDNIQQSESVLFTGGWSEEGCTLNENLSNSTTTVCECTHLTHFAILLSAKPIQDVLALTIIGNIGVAISLVAMAAVVFVFMFLKPLRTMRNYIHIQLCVTLGIAQIIFVAGVEPRLGEGQLACGVPIGCRLVAVLLHYWFLVSFMWMLMEGVVLYVVLVRVFIKHHRRYIAAFTVASYGLPLVYIGCLTLPLGFARTEEMRESQNYDYGYEEACYLNPDTGFVWSIIAPVILILLANTGFFIMAIVIMQRHQRRQQKDRRHTIKHWLKASISLTLVMGITWIIGVLALEVDALFPLAYIFTIFVAFQGLFIFVVFVLLSQQVRENYGKWWKAKVAESDFLSKHFGDKSLTLGATGTTVQKSAPSSSLGKSSGHSSLSKNHKQSLTIENSYSNSKSQELTDSSNGEVDIEMKRASPNLYEYHAPLDHSVVLS